MASWAFFNHVCVHAGSDSLNTTTVVIHPRILNPLSVAVAFVVAGLPDPQAPSDLSIPHEPSLFSEIKRTLTLLFSSQSSFRPAPEDVAKLLSELFKSYKTASKNSPATEAFLQEVIQLSVDVFLDLLKQQANSRKLFGIVCAPQLLGTLFELYSVGFGGVRAKLDRAFDIALFNQSSIPEFASYFASASHQRRANLSGATVGPPSSKKRKLNSSETSAASAVPVIASFARQLFESLHSIISESPTIHFLPLAFGVLFERFLAACESLSGRAARRVAAIATEASESTTDGASSTSTLETSLEFAFLLEAAALLERSPLDAPLRLQALDSLLSCAAKHEIYKFAATSERSEAHQRDALDAIVSQLFLSAPVDVLLSGLRSIVLMNHSIVEPFLNRVFVQLWSMPSGSVSPCAAPFVCALFETYSSLRQFDELLKVICTCLREWDSPTDELWFFEDETIWSTFASVVATLPPGQLAPIWHSFSEDISDHYVGPILAASAAYASIWSPLFLSSALRCFVG